MTYKDTRTDILDLIPKGGICAEIGVFTGDFSKEILNRISPDILYLVDIWSGKMTSGDKDGNNIKTIQNMEETYNEIKSLYENTKNVEVVRQSSSDFLHKFEGFFDFIYLDGDHTYDAVLKDCKLSFDKLKNNSYLAGHDYIDNYEVKLAVDDFCKQYNQTIDIVTLDGCPSFLINK